MNKCKLCAGHMNAEDLLADQDLCLSCLNDTDGEDESYGTLLHSRLPGGELLLSRTNSGYTVDVIAHNYSDETKTHLVSRHKTMASALLRYEGALRIYL